MVVEAAGGVVWRVAADGRVEVVLIVQANRPGWTLPKGKLRRGEPADAGALREVREETGLRCELGAELGATEYVDRRGRAKRVRWWAMRSLAGRLRVSAEVTAVRWFALEDALAELQLPRDVAIVGALRGLLVPAR